jgi:integrase
MNSKLPLIRPFDDARQSWPPLPESQAAPSAPKQKERRGRARGTGSIFRQPGTKCWTIQYFQNGRRVREKTGTDDKKAAQQRLTQRLAQIDKGEPIVVNCARILVSDLYDAVERDYRKNGKSTLASLKVRWTHLKPFFANMQAINVTKDKIENFIDQRLQEGAARATVNREIAVLKRGFKLVAEKLPRLPAFPAMLTENNTRTGFVEDHEFDRLVACAASELWLRTFLEIAYSLGWRVSEIIGLRVKQVDLRKRIIRLEPGTTKNKDGREGPLHDELYQLLSECVDGKSPEDFVLTRAGNRPIRDFRGRWQKLCEAAELPNLLVHDLRRSAARNLRAAGVSESVVMALGGWRTAEMFRRYAICSNKDKRNAIDLLEQQRAANQKREAEFSHKVSHSFASKSHVEATVSAALVN